jgi:signal transduction histidine kinase
VAPDLPQICVDFAQWVRVLHNIAENALLYSPPGSTVRVSARELGDTITMWVEDSGPGVPDDEKPHVFEKFYRGAVAADAPAGTGLGLAIAREIVRTHGGRIWVEDVEPRGARFVVALPRKTG